MKMNGTKLRLSSPRTTAGMQEVEQCMEQLPRRGSINHNTLKHLDDSLRSPFGPPLRAFNALALLSRLRGNDEIGGFTLDLVPFP